MDTCYLCGELMINRKDYTSDHQAFKAMPKFKHGEHVIQDAIYGRLKAEAILCESCGGQLSREVDADFVKIFQSITEQFSEILASTEKNKNHVPSLNGHVILKGGRKIDVFIKGGIINPSRPFFDPPVNGEVKIYAEKNTAKDFINYAKAELKKAGHDINALKYTIISDLQDHLELGINFSEGIENFDHKFKMGFIKIATGFAMMNGVDRSEVPNTIDSVANKLKYTDHIVPFAPCEAFEVVYDHQRIALEPEFPNHTIILYVDDFDTKKKLVCYVDLFSTFAYYVVLHDDYQGKDVHAVYQQSITKLEKSEINVKAEKPKHLMIIEQFLNIKPEDVRGMTLAERYEYVEKRYNQYTVSYQMVLRDTIDAVVGKIAINIAAKKIDNLDLLPKLESEMIESMPELNVDDLFLIREEYLRMQRENPEKLYRQTHLAFDDNHDISVNSNLYQLSKRLHKDMAGIQQHTHAKFNILSYFIDNHKTATTN